MITHLRGNEARPDIVPADSEHVGEMTNRWETYHVSTDKLFEVGYQDFAGECWNPPRDGYELVSVILSGSGELTVDGETYPFTAGDVIIQTTPLPEKVLRSPGFRAVYITRFRGAEAAAARGSILPADEPEKE